MAVHLFHAEQHFQTDSGGSIVGNGNQSDCGKTAESSFFFDDQDFGTLTGSSKGCTEACHTAAADHHVVGTGTSEFPGRGQYISVGENFVAHHFTSLS